MKIQIKEESIKEVEFHTPSFWMQYGVKYMVTEKNVIWAYGATISVGDIAKVQDIIKGDYKMITEDDFFWQYNKSLDAIRESIQIHRHAIYANG